MFYPVGKTTLYNVGKPRLKCLLILVPQNFTLMLEKRAQSFLHE